MKQQSFSYFRTPEVIEKVKKYEGMASGHTSVFLEVEDLLDIAQYYKIEGLDTKFKQVLNYSLNVYPDNPNFLSLRAILLKDTGHFDEAEKLFNGLPNVNELDILKFRLELQLAKGKKEPDSSLADEIYSKEDDKLDAILDICSSYLLAFRNDLAEKWVNLLLQQTPEKLDTDEADHILQLYYAQNEDFEKALVYQKRILDRDPYDPHRWCGMAELYGYLHKEKEAYSNIDYALAIDENNLMALETKANIDVIFNNFDSLSNTMQKMRELYEESDEIFKKLHNYYCNLILNPKKALAICEERLKKISPEDSSRRSAIYFMMVEDFVQLEDYVSAKKYIMECLRIHPQDLHLLCFACYIEVLNGEEESKIEKTLQINTEASQEEKEKSYTLFIDLLDAEETKEECIKCCEAFLKDLKGKSYALHLRAAKLYLDINDISGYLDHYAEPYYLNGKTFRKEDVENDQFKKYFDYIADMEKSGAVPFDFHYFVKDDKKKE